MAHVELTDDMLIVHVDGADRFLAFKSRIECPLEHVEGAEIGVEPDVQESFNRSMRWPGSYMPPFVIAGTYVYRHEGQWSRQFWDVHHREKILTIRLAHEKYKTLVIEVDDPQATIAAIEAVLAKRHTGAS